MGEKETRRIGKKREKDKRGNREKERLRKDKVQSVEVRTRSLAIERAFTCSVLAILVHDSFYYYY